MASRNKESSPEAKKHPPSTPDTKESSQFSESRYRRLFETARDGILLLNFNTAQIEDANPFLIEMLGYSLKEFKGKKLWDISPFKDVVPSKNAFAELQQKGYIRYEDIPLETKDGRKVQVEFVSNVYDCEGEKVIQCNIRDITERKVAEAEYRAIIRTTMDGFLVTDMQGRFLDMNDAYCRIVGYDRSELLGMDFADVNTVESPETIADHIRRAREEGHGRFDIQHGRKDGTILNLDVSVNFMPDGGGRMIAFVRDITELKRAELALLQEKAFSDAVIESAPGAFFVIDAQKNLVRWNSFLSSETGFSDEQLPGTSILPYIYEQDRPLATAKILAAFATGFPQKIELRVQTRDRGLRVFFTTIRRFEVGGDFFLAGFGLDVTERKRIEDALTKEKEFSDALIESVPGAFFVVDPEGNYVRWNSYLNRLTGVTDAQLLHMPSLLAIQEEDRHVAAAMMKEAFETGYSKAELHILTLDRGSRVFLIKARRFKVDEAFYLVGVGIDTTDRQADEQELELKASTDPLTGLSNRGHFMALAAQELERSRRYGHPLSLWMLDIDYFKSVNDTHGHHAGDLALQSLVGVSHKVLRDQDIMGRIGGEEFAVLLPETDAEQALLVAERLRQKVATTEIPLEQEKAVRCTISIGVATLGDDETGIETLLGRADKALYRAKKTGRDKVCVAESIAGAGAWPGNAMSADVSQLAAQGRQDNAGIGFEW